MRFVVGNLVVLAVAIVAGECWLEVRVGKHLDMANPSQIFCVEPFLAFSPVSLMECCRQFRRVETHFLCSSEPGGLPDSPCSEMQSYKRYTRKPALIALVPPFVVAFVVVVALAKLYEETLDNRLMNDSVFVLILVEIEFLVVNL